MKKNILHVSTHYGGGVGSVVRAIVKNDKENNHTISYLNNIDKNKNNYSQLFNNNLIEENDIVLCHVWNHPAMFEFLTGNSIPACRLIGWSHMSGLHAPYVLFDYLMDFFDEFYYTSPVSNLSGTIKPYIWSCCDIEKFSEIKKEKQERFTIGYVGTLDYCKIHPEFLGICKKIIKDIPDVKFLIVGDGCDAENMKQNIAHFKLDYHFEFTGPVSDTRPYLGKMDLFMYPLQPKHFGTCEQVIGEAMAASVPVVALNNPAESIIIIDGINGFIANKVEEIPIIASIIHDNIDKESLLREMIDTAKKYALLRYSPYRMVEHWNDIFNGIIKKEKSERKKWAKPIHIFADSLGPVHGKIFEDYVMDNHAMAPRRYEYYNPKIHKIFSENPQWLSKSKGSVRQYLEYFPDDPYLGEWEKLI